MSSEKLIWMDMCMHVHTGMHTHRVLNDSIIGNAILKQKLKTKAKTGAKLPLLSQKNGFTAQVMRQPKKLIMEIKVPRGQSWDQDVILHKGMITNSFR